MMDRPIAQSRPSTQAPSASAIAQDALLAIVIVRGRREREEVVP